MFIDDKWEDHSGPTFRPIDLCAISPRLSLFLEVSLLHTAHQMMSYTLFVLLLTDTNLCLFLFLFLFL